MCAGPRASGTLRGVDDPPPHAEDALTLDAALSFLSGTHLELLVEIKQEGLAAAVIDKLVAHKVAARSIVFAFAEVARSFPWQLARAARLGVIVTYPWQIERTMRVHAPDVLLLGWDDRAWTRIAFRAWWSLFALERLGRRYNVPVVAGIVQRSDDLAWLSRQHLYAAVADIDPPSGRAPGAAGIGDEDAVHFTSQERSGPAAVALRRSARRTGSWRSSSPSSAGSGSRRRRS